jgi:uncharacterized protein (TIGR03435 family)
MRSLPRLPYPIFHILGAALILSSIQGVHLQASSPPSFVIATVKPVPDADPNTGNWSYPGIGRFTGTHVSLAVLIQLAYDVTDAQIANKPGWLETTAYDVVAKPEAGIKLSREELKPRLQNLLEERFHLKVHTEIRPVRGYALVIGKGGPRLNPTQHENFPGDFVDVSSGHMNGAHWSMQQLAKYLARPAGFPVVDQTGITGRYDINFSYNPKPEDNGDLPPLGTALEQATGLSLKEQRVPVETIVIDSVDKVPTEN